MRGGRAVSAARTPVRPPAPTTLVPMGWVEVPSPDASERVFEQFGVAAFGEQAAGWTLDELADALRASTVPRPENWTWPRRPPGMAPSGRAEPVRAAFCRFLDTGEPYYREDTL